MTSSPSIREASKLLPHPTALDSCTLQSMHLLVCAYRSSEPQLFEHLASEEAFLHPQDWVKKSTFHPCRLLPLCITTVSLFSCVFIRNADIHRAGTAFYVNIVGIWQDVKQLRNVGKLPSPSQVLVVFAVPSWQTR